MVQKGGVVFEVGKTMREVPVMQTGGTGVGRGIRKGLEVHGEEWVGGGEEKPVGGGREDWGWV